MSKVTDYHDFSHPDTPKEKRNKLNIGDIYINGAECKICDYFIRSRNRHDMVTCKCGNVSVDGGSMYQKINYKDIDKVKLICIMYNDIKRTPEEVLGE